MLCNKLTIYSTKCFILCTVIHQERKDGVSQMMVETEIQTKTVASIVTKLISEQNRLLREVQEQVLHQIIYQMFFV